MRCQIVTRIAFSDKGAQLDIFPRHLLRTYIIVKNGMQFSLSRSMSQCHYLLYFTLMIIFCKAIKQAIEGHLGRIRDK